MSVKFIPTTGYLKIYQEGKSYENRDPFDAIITVQFLGDTVAYLSGAKGEVGIKGIAKGLKELQSMGIEKVLMERRGKVVERMIAPK
jgi:hypothetical protein